MLSRISMDNYHANELGAGEAKFQKWVVTQPPTHADVAYGPHERNVLDFWRSEGEGPRPVLVGIHGGGWRVGNKDEFGRNMQSFYDAGISIAVINYRLIPEHPLPAPVHDAARAIQFLRSKAKEWNIDEERVAARGTSAGGCSLLYLLFQEDLADPDSSDPVLRESSRLIAGVSEEGQTSIDPKFIEPLLGRHGITHPMIYQSMGELTIEDALANYDNHAERYREFSPINHVRPGAPPVYLAYTRSPELPATDSGHGIHHPMFGVKLKETCDAAGVECHLVAKGIDLPKPGISLDAFLMQKLLGR